MLLRLHHKQKAITFGELLELATNLLNNAQTCNGVLKTTVLGPITANGQTTREENLVQLEIHEKALDTTGFAVLSLTSFQPCVEELLTAWRNRYVQKHGICSTLPYPNDLLEHFTVPLIRSGMLDVLHFRPPGNSFGTKRELAVALNTDIKIVYVD